MISDGILVLNKPQNWTSHDCVAICRRVLRLKGIEALKDVSDGRATKIYMPSDIAGVVASLGVAGEALGIGDHTKIDTSPKPKKEVPVDPCLTDETGKGGREAAAATARILRVCAAETTTE